MPPFTILRAKHLFDGTSAVALESAAVLIDGETVRATGHAAEIRQPDGAEVTIFDYGDATILPGLVDVHTHMMGIGDGTLGDDLVRDYDDDMLLLRAAQNARRALHSGVTTARENGAKGRVAFSLKEGMRRGLVAGPRMVVSGRPLSAEWIVDRPVL